MDEITAEFAVQELLPPVELRVIPRLIVGAKTDIGRVREVNEDKFEYFLAPTDEAMARTGHIFVQCDGMGGHAAGQHASELSAKTFIDAVLNHTSDDLTHVAFGAINLAQRYVFNISQAIPSRRGMGTTLDGLIISQDQFVIAHIGDSRVYRMRGGELERLTKDHSWVQMMVDSGAMTEEEGESHPNRNIVTKCIGSPEDFTPDILMGTLEAGDTYLLCSDGVTKHVADAQIAEILGTGGPSDQAWRLIAAALQGGGTDNATTVIVHVAALDAP